MTATSRKAAVLSGGAHHVTMSCCMDASWDEAAHAVAIFETAHKLAGHSGIRPSRTPEADVVSTREDNPALEIAALHNGSGWTIHKALPDAHGAIAGLLVRTTEAKAYEALAAPVGRLAIRLMTERRILNSGTIVWIKPGADGAVTIEAVCGLQVKPGFDIERPPIDPRVARVLFAIGYALWLREGETFHNGEKTDGRATAIDVLTGDRSRVRSPESSTLHAAERAGLAAATMVEIGPVLSWLRGGGLNDEADGLEAAAGDLVR